MPDSPSELLNPKCSIPGTGPLTNWEVIEVLCIYIVGFFATAGAAGADIASNAATSTTCTSAASPASSCRRSWRARVTLWIVGSAYGAGMVPAGNLNPVDLMSDIFGHVSAPKWASDRRQHRDDRAWRFRRSRGPVFRR